MAPRYDRLPWSLRKATTCSDYRSKAKSMQIGDLSQRSGVNIETIRYYERIGVLPAPARLPNGRRSYDEADAQRLGFIRHARDLGFDLASVRILLGLQEQPEASCENASRIAQAQLEAVENRITSLLSLRDELSRMVSECRRGIVSECRVIEALSLPSQSKKRVRSS